MKLIGFINLIFAVIVFISTTDTDPTFSNTEMVLATVWGLLLAVSFIITFKAKDEVRQLMRKTFNFQMTMILVICIFSFVLALINTPSVAVHGQPSEALNGIQYLAENPVWSFETIKRLDFFSLIMVMLMLWHILWPLLAALVIGTESNREFNFPLTIKFLNPHR